MAIVVPTVLALFSLLMISELEVVGNSWGPTECREDYTVSDHYLFPSKGTSRDTIFLKFCSIWSMHCTDIILPNFVVFNTFIAMSDRNLSWYNSQIDKHEGQT